MLFGLSGQLLREPCFAHAARAGQHHQSPTPLARAVERLRQLRHFLLPADEDSRWSLRRLRCRRDAGFGSIAEWLRWPRVDAPIVSRGLVAELNGESANRPRDVLQTLHALVGEGRIDAARNDPAHRVRNGDAAGCGQSVESGGDIHAVAVHAAVGLFNDVAQVHPDAKVHAPVRRDSLGIVRQRDLHRQGCVDRTGGGFERRQHRVARHVDDATLMGFDLRPEQRAGGIERAHRRALVIGHQAREADRVGGQDRGQSMSNRWFGHGFEDRRSNAAPPCSLGGQTQSRG